MKNIFIGIVIVSNVLYTLLQSFIPDVANPAIALCCMYIGGLICALPFYLKSINKKKQQVDKAKSKDLIKRAFLFGITNIVIDLGFFLAFKSGWSVGYFNVVANISILIVLTVTGIVFFKEKISLLNALGIIIGIAGLSLLNL